MTTQIEKRGGADFTVFYMDTVNGEKLSMTIYGAKDAEDALGEAKHSFGDGAHEIEFVAVIRDGVKLEEFT